MQANSFDSNAVFFTHPQFHRNMPAEMVSIVDQRSIKASPKRKNVPVVSDEAETLRNKVARLESRLGEIESKIRCTIRCLNCLILFYEMQAMKEYAPTWMMIAQTRGQSLMTMDFHLKTPIHLKTWKF